MTSRAKHHNLNVPHHATSIAQVKSVVDLNRSSASMQVVALSVTHTPGTMPLAQSAPMNLQCMNETIQQLSNSDMTILRRFTVVLNDTKQLHELTQLSPTMLQFDLVALRPTDEKTLRAACCDFDAVDVIALALTDRLAFSFKHSTISVAIHRGIYFEIDVAPLFRPELLDARRNTLSQAVALVRATHGRNIIITCSALSLTELRTASDIINLGRVLGLTQKQAHAAVTLGAARCVARGRFRCTTRSLGVVELRNRTALDDAAFGIQDDDDDDDDE
jgi:ribonuclease P/MRP protein subunit RPP1